jgi:hypothetical protein
MQLGNEHGYTEVAGIRQPDRIEIGAERNMVGS